MKDINKLFNHITGLQTYILEDLLPRLDQDKTVLVKLSRVAEINNTQIKYVKQLIKILVLVEVIEQLGSTRNGVAIKVIDVDTFNRLKEHFDL